MKQTACTETAMEEINNQIRSEIEMTLADRDEMEKTFQALSKAFMTELTVDNWNEKITPSVLAFHKYLHARLKIKFVPV